MDGESLALGCDFIGTKEPDLPLWLAVATDLPADLLAVLSRLLVKGNVDVDASVHGRVLPRSGYTCNGCRKFCHNLVLTQGSYTSVPHKQEANLTDTDIRDSFTSLIDRLNGVRTRTAALSGNRQPLSFPDWHVLAEGVLLYAWTGWETFLRSLFVMDLATDTGSVLRKDVKAGGFRYAGSPMRIASMIVDHPDDGKFVEWNSIDSVRSRADSMLPNGHRYGSVTGNQIGEVRRTKTVRNAVAHKSDAAWASFIELVSMQPYSLTSNQRKGLTVGRFLVGHKIAQQSVLEHYLTNLRACATALVP